MNEGGDRVISLDIYKIEIDKVGLGMKGISKGHGDWKNYIIFESSECIDDVFEFIRQKHNLNF